MAIKSVTTQLNGQEVELSYSVDSSIYTAAIRAPIVGEEDKDYLLSVSAQDEADNIATEERTITVNSYNNIYLNGGYVSESIYRSSYSGRLPFRLGGMKPMQVYENGYWENGDPPEITIDFESAWTCFGIHIQFRSLAPRQFTFRTYNDGVLVDTYTEYDNTETDYSNYEEFRLFNKMVITFEKGTPNSRVFIDKILFGDFTDYTLTRLGDISGNVKGTRYNKLKSLTVNKQIYQLSKEEIQDIHSEEIFLQQGTSDITVYMSNASYDLSVVFDEPELAEGEEPKDTDFIAPEGMTCEIIDYSNFYATIRFSGVPEDNFRTKYILKGFEYEISEQPYTKSLYGNGDVEEWDNPLISNNEQASKLEEWLETVLCGDVDYQVNWRGDPRVDANDLFYLEQKTGDLTLIRAYESTLKYNGAFSGILKGRKAELRNGS